jgi:vacuolar-type H+-ATPase subunit E/Vma4
VSDWTEYTQDIVNAALEYASRIADALERIAKAIETEQGERLPDDVYREMAPPERSKSAYHNPPPAD